jgi:hypothetical protein
VLNQGDHFASRTDNRWCCVFAAKKKAQHKEASCVMMDCTRRRCAASSHLHLLSAAFAQPCVTQEAAAGAGKGQRCRCRRGSRRGEGRGEVGRGARTRDAPVFASLKREDHHTGLSALSIAPLVAMAAIENCVECTKRVYPTERVREPNTTSSSASDCLLLC